MSSRIGKGPWTRAFGAALVPDEADPVAVRGRELAGSVEALTIEVGLITAHVDGCAVALAVLRVPPGIWAAMRSSARNRGVLERAVAGEVQSEQLQHLMAQDWDEPLVPAARAIERVCSCDPGGACEHVAALAYRVADAIDLEPAALLRWRGCVEADKPGQATRATGDPWSGGALPELPKARRRAVSVPRRLGSSGIRVGDRDLASILDRAYAAFDGDS